MYPPKLLDLHRYRILPLVCIVLEEVPVFATRLATDVIIILLYYCQQFT